MSSPFWDGMLLGQARQLTLKLAAEDGVSCPCCDQLAKVYRRALPSAAARVLIEMWKRDEGRDYLYVPAILDKMTGTPAMGGYGVISHFWELIEAQPGRREDGSDRVGWWRLTDRGRVFVRGLIPVHKYALIYNGKCLGLNGEMITIVQALGNKFDYRSLMDGV